MLRAHSASSTAESTELGVEQCMLCRLSVQDKKKSSSGGAVGSSSGNQGADAGSAGCKTRRLSTACDDASVADGSISQLNLELLPHFLIEVFWALDRKFGEVCCMSCNDLRATSKLMHITLCTCAAGMTSC